MAIKVPERARAHILAHPRQPTRKAAAVLNVHPDTVRKWRHRLIQENALRPLRKRLSLDAVREQFAEGKTADAAARALGVSEDSLRAWMMRRGLRVEDMRGGQAYTGSDVARILGYSPQHVGRMLRRGVIVGRHAAREWRVTADALMAFLEHPECPIDPARIADPDWRAYAEAARAGHIKPVRVVDWREAPRCAECGEPVSKSGRLCRACSMRAAQRRRYAAAD